jgi:hypothetical protein
MYTTPSSTPKDYKLRCVEKATRRWERGHKEEVRWEGEHKEVGRRNKTWNPQGGRKEGARSFE